MFPPDRHCGGSVFVTTVNLVGTQKEGTPGSTTPPFTQTTKTGEIPTCGYLEIRYPLRVGKRPKEIIIFVILIAFDQMHPLYICVL